ncbi:MAG: RNA polymerase sigma factor, partial [Acidimicrobiales bacterium]
MLTDIRTWDAGSDGELSADLLIAARSGDARAFRSLFDALAPVAWRTALILTGETTGAADAVAIGAGRAFGTTSASSAQIGDPTVAMLRATWLAALDILHRDRRRGDGPTNAEAEASEPPVTAETNLDAALVSFAFLTMPEQWRGALWLTEAEGLSHGVAGAVLDLVPSAFGQLLNDARAGFVECGPRVDAGGKSRPAEIGDVSTLLRPALGVVPVDLDAAAAERWQAALVSRTGWHRIVKSVAERTSGETPILRKAVLPFGSDLAPTPAKIGTLDTHRVPNSSVAADLVEDAGDASDSAVARIRAIIASMDTPPAPAPVALVEAPVISLREALAAAPVVRPAPAPVVRSVPVVRAAPVVRPSTAPVVRPSPAPVISLREALAAAPVVRPAPAPV